MGLGLIEAGLAVYLLLTPVAALSTPAFLLDFWLLFRAAVLICDAVVLWQLGYAGWGWIAGASALGPGLDGNN